VHLLDHFQRLFSVDFMPHAYCLREPGLIAIHAVADGIIAFSYLLIPAALVILVRRQRDIAFPWMFALFAVFILGCGATHVLAVVTLWRPIYRFDALLKIITALASIGTAVMLFRLLPQLMLIPSPAQLREVNARLEETAAAAEAASLAKGTFLSTMSHEIRTPMNAILGYAQLMLRDPGLGADAKANLQIIGRSGEHLMRLINNILDMSKIEAGRTEINTITFNLYRVLDDLAEMFRLRSEAKALRFELLVDGEPVPYVLADEGKIRQVLINLLGNSIKFTKRGYVKLHVTLEKRSAGQLWLSARIEDSGSGMTAPELEKLFQPFRQSERGLNVQEGTGLGLAISRQFARLMGGDITVSSDPGQGSVFRFEVPIESGDASVAVKLSDARRVLSIRAATHSPRVLVVDDQFENRDWLIKLLTSIGFSVREAENGQAAFNNWKEWSPELILMDVHMPVMDGLEATRRIKAEPGGRETAIVVLTASALDEDRRSVAQSGADDFLSKPCREDELLEKLRAHLDIVYDYEETSVNPCPPLNGAGLSSDRLARLPLELVEELRDATLSGNKRRLDELILKVSATGEAGCAHGLRELADKYEYDALTRLLDEACRR